MPLALRTGNAMARNVINYYLEYDENDEGAPTLLGFTLKGLVVGAVFAATTLLVWQGVEGVLSSALPDQAGAMDMLDPGKVAALTSGMVLELVEQGFRAAAVTTVFSFATAPLYLMGIRLRDRAGKDTSGTGLRVLASCVAAAVFVVLAIVALSRLWV